MANTYISLPAIISVSIVGPVVVSGTVAVSNFPATQPISAVSLPLPTGASTSLLQLAGNASLVSIDSKLNAPLSVIGPLTNTELRATPVPVSGTVTSNQGTSPWVTNLTQIGGAAFALGQQLAAASLPVVLTAAQLATLTPLSTVAVTQSTSPWVVSGTVAATQSGTWNINNISGTISLPTGASTLAEQQSQTALLNTINGHLDVNLSTRLAEATFTSRINTLGQKTMANSTPVVLASDQTVIPVSQSGSWTVSATQGTSPWVTNLTQVGGASFALGQQLAAAALPIVLTAAQLATLTPLTTVAVTQSTSPWVISGTVLVSNLPTTVDTNYGTVGASTLRSAAQIGNSTGAAAFNAGTTTAQTLRVVLPTDQTAIPVTQSTSPWVVGQATASSLNAQVVGNVANAATDSGNPVKAGGKVNTTAPTYTDGQRADLQQDTTGSLYVNPVSRKASYSSTSTFVIAATATDIFTLTGSASKTVLLKSISISGINTNNSNVSVVLLKRSTANSGGTSTTPTVVPHDSNNPAGTAVIRSYTANPTTGTLVGNIAAVYIFFPLLGSTNVSQQFVYDVTQGVQPLTLRGTSEVYSINLQGATITGTTTISVRFTWSEE